MMIRFVLIFILLGFVNIFATQEFTMQMIKSYLTDKNFYIYKTLGQNYVLKEQLKFKKGAFDTQIVANYDEKDYPTSKGSYYDVLLNKPTQSGIDLSIGYRYADGIQEYNNIKTGMNGEYVVGVNIPLLSLLNKIDQRRLKVGIAKMDVEKSEFQYKESMRSFYFNLMTTYFTLLYNIELEKLSQNILEKMKKRENFLIIKVAQGSLPKVALLDAKQQVLRAKQNYISSKRDSKNKLIEFLKYLNITDNEFMNHYHLPNLPNAKKINFSFEESLKKAIKNRPDLKILNVEKRKLFIANKNNELQKYPKFDLGVNGVYDENEQSGIKVSLQMSFPIARSQYSAKSAEIKQSIKVVDNQKALQLLELKADILSVINSLQLLISNIENSKDEIALLRELETFEKRKYELGSSTLFILNQRETQTVQAQAQLLKYKLQYQLFYQAYQRIINIQEKIF